MTRGSLGQDTVMYEKPAAAFQAAASRPSGYMLRVINKRRQTNRKGRSRQPEEGKSRAPECMDESHGGVQGRSSEGNRCAKSRWNGHMSLMRQGKTSYIKMLRKKNCGRN